MPLDNVLSPRGVGRAEPAGGMGTVRTDREEMWGQRNSSWQGQLQAAETWAGSERELLPETPLEEGFRHLFISPQGQEMQSMSHLFSSQISSRVDSLECLSVPPWPYLPLQ